MVDDGAVMQVVVQGWRFGLEEGELTQLSEWSTPAEDRDREGA